MALHGQVMVNRQVIAYWSARRVEILDDLDATYTYECEVVWPPTRDEVRDAKPWPRVDFEIQHQYSRGATALASQVLGWVTSEAPL